MNRCKIIYSVLTILFVAAAYGFADTGAGETVVYVRDSDEAARPAFLMHYQSGMSRENILNIILAVYPSGKIVWSDDRIKGGAPYYSAQIDPDQVEEAMDKTKEAGLLDVGDRFFVPPDAGYASMTFNRPGHPLVKFGTWHEALAAYRAEKGTVVESENKSDLERQIAIDWDQLKAIWFPLIPAEGAPDAAIRLEWQRP